MKKISKILILFIILVNFSSCTGYTPIFSSSSLDFKIANYSILGDKKIGNRIYSKLNYLSERTKESPNLKSIEISINSKKSKSATAKDKTGKILAYKINLSTSIIVKDSITGDLILNNKFTSSSSYDIQSQYSETLKRENKSIENLIDRTFEDLLIRLSENIS